MQITLNEQVYLSTCSMSDFGLDFVGNYNPIIPQGKVRREEL